jgi:hypothetical protein
MGPGRRGHALRWSALFIGALAGAATFGTIADHAAFAAKSGTAGAVEIEVLALSSNDAVEEAAAMTDAFHHALVAAPAMTDAGKSRALEAVALAIGCDEPMLPACAPKLAATLKSDRFVYGVVKKTPPNRITVTVALYDASVSKTAPARTAVRTYEASPVSRDGASPELQRIAQGLLFELIGGHSKASIEVVVSGPAAAMTGDLYEGDTLLAKVTGGRATVEAGAGKHHLELRAAGYATAIADVDVGPDGAHAEFIPVSSAARAPTDWKLYKGIGFAGGGLLFLTLGAVESFGIRSIQNDPNLATYRRRWPTSTGDTCSQAQNGVEGPGLAGSYTTKLAPTVSSLCSSASTKEILQWVFYAVGAAGVGYGGYLIWTDLGARDAGVTRAPTPAAASIRVAPVVSTSFSGVAFTGAF